MGVNFNSYGLTSNVSKQDRDKLSKSGSPTRSLRSARQRALFPYDYLQPEGLLSGVKYILRIGGERYRTASNCFSSRPARNFKSEIAHHQLSDLICVPSVHQPLHAGDIALKVIRLAERAGELSAACKIKPR